MILVLQRVSSASVVVNNQNIANIKKGLLILQGIGIEDSEDDIAWLVKKTINIRIFGDDKGMMNLSIKDIGGEIIVVSQFTLMASTKKGNRPSFINAAKPDLAEPLYETFVEQLRAYSGLNVQTGSFGADMKVGLTNDGPVTIILDSKNRN